MVAVQYLADLAARHQLLTRSPWAAGGEPLGIRLSVGRFMTGSQLRTHQESPHWFLGGLPAMGGRVERNGVAAMTP